MGDRFPAPPVEAPTSGDSGFAFRPSAAGRALTCDRLAAYAPHLFTTVALPLSADAPEEGYPRVADALEAAPGAVVGVRQVHGRTVALVRPGQPPDPVEADALVCLDPGRVVLVRTADCVPILLADRQRRLVAAVHAGWRGTAADVVTATLEAIARLGVPAHDLVAAIGPAAGGCCYEVDQTVRDAFTAADLPAAPWFTPDGDRWRLDLAAANRSRLVAAGLPPGAVHVAGRCTIHEGADWPSYRRDGRRAGRMLAAIRIRPDGGAFRS